MASCLSRPGGRRGVSVQWRKFRTPLVIHSELWPKLFRHPELPSGASICGQGRGGMFNPGGTGVRDPCSAGTQQVRDTAVLSAIRQVLTVEIAAYKGAAPSGRSLCPSVTLGDGEATSRRRLRKICLHGCVLRAEGGRRPPLTVSSPPSDIAPFSSPLLSHCSD